MKFKKVTGERIVAAIVDSIIVSIIAAIPTVIYFFSQGFDALFDFYVDGAGTVETGSGYNTFTTISAVAGLVVGVIYFCYIPFKWNGQTLGKKMMNIKAIDEFGNNPTFKQHVIRGVQNWSTFVTVLTVPLLYVNILAFSVVGGLVSTLASLLVFAAFIMMLVKEDGKGLHDVWANTMVVKADIDFDQNFVEKTTQMSDWADVKYDDEETTDTDDWYEKPTDTSFDKKKENKDDKDDDPWKY